MLPRVEERENYSVSGLASPQGLAGLIESLWLELNSTPGAVDAGVEASTNAVTDGRFSYGLQSLMLGWRHCSARLRPAGHHL